MTFYFVTTGLLTVRPRAQESLWIDRAAVAFVLTVSVLAFVAGVDLMRGGRPEAAPSFIFGIVGLLAATGDIRVLRGRVMQAPRRIARHLWRLSFAMWVAAASFFWGPPRRVPEAIRIPALQATAVLLPIAVMLYWLWRLRGRKTLHGLVTLSAAQAGPIEQF
jgi:F0F1-type ATP synthase assembly protein I